MRSKFSLGVASGVLAAVILVTPAFAWTFGVTGSGKCQQDGSFLISWKVSNPENEPLIVTSSSNPSLIPVNSQTVKSQIPVNGKGSGTVYTQSVDGTKPGNFSLALSGHWKSDKKDRSSSYTVKLYRACDQPVVPPVEPPVEPPVTPPVTPPTGGMGGGTTTPDPVTPTVAADPATPQVVAPVGAVSAGNGGAPKTLSLGSIAGLIVSLAVIAFGVRGFKKQS